MSSTNETNRLYLTNNYSIVSKYSAVKLGYFQDEILKDFIENLLNIKTWRRTPLVNRGYAARLLAIDWIVSRSIKYNSIDCAIVLGAGFDMLSLRRLGQCCWIEIDLPQVIETKSKFIIEKLRLDEKDVVLTNDGIISFKSINLHLIACDLRNTVDLSNKLNLTLSNVTHRRNVAIINEVCLCYLEMSEIKIILETVIQSVDNLAMKVHYIGYEQVRTNEKSQFSKVMIEHFSSLGHPLKYFPTKRQLKEVFVEHLKFNHVTIASMYQIFHNALFTSRLETSAFDREPFDEFEEMDLYLSHYSLVTGILIINDPFQSDPSENSSMVVEDNYDNLCEQVKSIGLGSTTSSSYEKSPIFRFGHSSCSLDDTNTRQSILVSGGFGMLDDTKAGKQQHKRLFDCTILSRDLQTGQNKTVSLSLENFPIDSICLDRMHGQVCNIGNNLLFFTGGRQSPLVKRNINTTPFIAKIENDKLVLVHGFCVVGSDTHLRWRHKTSIIQQDKLIQVGGINGGGNPDGHSVVIWNLSSSKLGFELPSSGSNEAFNLLERHSFGMDSKDGSTLLIFGGLQTNRVLKDMPVQSDFDSLIWDLRTSQPIKLARSAGCYGSQVHFISDYQFVKIGGISTSTGLPEENIELLDLRKDVNLAVQQEPLPVSEDFMILTNSTTCKFNNSSQIVTVGGGGNYFTFGTHFNRSHLVYKYA